MLTVKMKSHLFLTVSLLAAVFAEPGIECPFPEGQDSSSEAECAFYTACTWTGESCIMRDNGIIGYTVASEPQDTGRGFKVDLQLIDDAYTLFENDIPSLQCEVIYHEEYHVQIKITDTSSSRYEVPLPLTLPEMSASESLYSVVVAEAGEPFQLSILRANTSAPIFSTYGALVYEDQFIQFTSLLASTYLYGFGENSHEKLRHQFEPRNTWPIFARDQAIGTGFMNEYGHHPYYTVVEDSDGNTNSVLFLNSNAMEYSTFLLPDGSPALTLRTIGGIIDLHLFLGPTPEDVNVQYANMVGVPAFPPYWSLGFQLSRWGYTSTDHVREVITRTRAAGIPQDVQTVDIDYMERYRDFTYDQTNWGDLPALIDEIHADNMKMTLILDPALVIDWANYPPASRGRDVDAFIKWMSPDLIPIDQPEGANEYMVGYVWPDTKTVFPDFLKPETQSWWGEELAILYEELEFDAIWIDMNEPANFGTNMEKPWNWPEGQASWSLKCPYNKLDSPPYPTMMVRVGSTESYRISDHTLCMSAMQTDGESTYVLYDTHSLYGWSETVATYNGLQTMFPGKRQVVLSRSTFPGSGKYAVHWLGDNSADWTQMGMSVVGMLEFNLFAMPMVGADVCGFLFEPDEEMCSRWMELGAFYPFSRNHNAEGYADQDPAVNPTVAAISRDVLLLRYKFLPYLYSLFHKAHMHGNSVVRPLYNVFPTDITARDIDDQFLWGDFLMIAPVLTKGVTERDVYFPEGLWYDLVSGEIHSSVAGTQVISAPIEKIPVYVRGGAILPNQEPALNTVESRLNPFGLTIALDSGMSASGELFWDDGESEHVMSETYMARFTYSEGELSTSIMHGESMVAGLSFDHVVFYGFANDPASITVNGAALDASAWTFEEALGVLLVTIDAPLDEPLAIVIE